MANEPKPLLSIPVKYGNVSIGDGTARVGLKISRGDLKIDVADEALCGKRLTGRIVICGNDDDPAQGLMFDGMRTELQGVFDVKRFGVGCKEISCGLTFALDGLNLDNIGRFARKSGRMIVNLIQPLEAVTEVDEDEEVECDTDDAEDSSQAESMAEESVSESEKWKQMPIRALRPASLRHQNAFYKACKSKGLKTVGQLSIFMSNHGDWWAKDLGIGPQCREEMDAAFAEFWSRHPQEESSAT